MEINKDMKEKVNVTDEEHSFKGALFSSVVFVGGSICAFTLLLIVFYMIRI